MPRKYYCVDDFRLAAQQRMPRVIFDYVDGAAGFETSSRLNREVIEQVRLLPRVLVDIRQRELRSEEHTSELQSRTNLVCRLLLEKKKNKKKQTKKQQKNQMH